MSGIKITYVDQEMADEFMRQMLIERKLTREAFVKWKGYEPGVITAAFYLEDGDPAIIGKAWDIYDEQADSAAARYEDDIVRRWP